jgi:hypothetical protein
MSERDWFLAFVTRVKHEDLYIREWLEYHLLVGVEHFFLYDMDGGQGLAGILEPYEDAGVVTRIAWSHYEGTRLDRKKAFFRHNKSSLAHRHFARHFRRRVCWAQKIDGDEFLYPLAGDDVIGPLRAFDPNRVRGIGVPRFNFGHNGHERRPPGLTIESYLRREATQSSSKDMANGEFLSGNHFRRGSHRWSYRLHRRGTLVASDQVETLRINHYFTKSFEEFLIRQNTNRTRRQTREQFDDRNRRRNDVDDDGMLRFVPAVRRALGLR